MSDERRVAFVTGAGKGIGRAIAEGLAVRGLRVGAADVDEASLAWTSAFSDVFPLEVDVTSTCSIEDGLELALARYGRLDVVVNNAGIVDPGPSHLASDTALLATLDVNLLGAIRVCRAAYSALCQSDCASIVQVSSVTSSLGFPGRLAYAASKAALEAVTRTLAVEWGSKGIRVNAVAPGFVMTSGSAEIYAAGKADSRTRDELVPLRRHASPTEIADYVGFLALDATYASGQVAVVDGGFSVSAEMAVSNALDTSEHAT